MTYKTTDSIQAILFKTFGYPFMGSSTIIKPNGRLMVEFSFDVPKLETVEQMMKDYYNHVLEVDAYDHDEAWKFIRKEIYVSTHED